MLAKALCCEKGPAIEPCNECEICVSITEGNCMDVLEMDAASEAGVEDVRETIVRVAEYAPSRCRYKVFIVDEVHDLSPKAFDALLKTLEEPPAHLIFILATTEYHKVPATIRSRCQKFEFHRGTLQNIASRLEHVAKAEGIEAEPAALSAMARMSDGGYRDALNLLEQAAMTADGPINLQHVYDQLGLIDEQAIDELLLAVRGRDVPKIVELVSEWSRLGRDPRAILESALYRLADLTRSAYGIDDAGPGDGARAAAEHEMAARLGAEHLLRLRSAMSEAHRVIRDISLPRIWLEAELIRIAGILNEQGPSARQDTSQAEPSRPSRAKDVKSSSPAKPKSEDDSSPAVAASPESEAPAAQEASSLPNGEATSVEDEIASPELKRAREVWKKVVAAIEKTGKNVAITRKLHGTNVIGFESGVIRIEFARQIDYDGILEGNNGPARAKKILDLVRRESGEEWSVEYSVSKRKSNGTPTAAAVELPLEGQKLLDAAREIFPGA